MLYAGQRLKADRYEAVVPLRRGGMGVVWRGLDRKRGDEVALKVLAVEAGGVAAMEREAEAALRVPHPNVLAPRDTFVDGDVAVLVLELCAGSVADVLAEEGALTPEVALALLEGPLDALGAAHAAGVVHRDVKPSNLLVRGDGTVLLADFGIARMLADARATTRSAALLGSLPFMAPEQRRDPRDVSPATDVYAAAATLATMLTGAPVGDLFVPYARVRLTTAGVPDDLCDVLLRAGSWSPGERPGDARAFLAELRGCASGGGATDNDASDTEGARLRAGVVPSGRGWSGDEVAVSGESWGGRGARPPSATPSPGDVATTEGVARAVRTAATGWAVASGGLALLAGLGGGAWVALRDDVRELLAPQPESVRRAAALAAIPTCATPGGWTQTVAPRMEIHPDGLREATTWPLVTDLDTDGQPDLIYVHNASEAARIWWGEAGKLLDPMAPVDVPAPRGRSTPVAGDFDGNGLPDVLYIASDGLWWLPQVAQRSFGEARRIEEVEDYQSMSAGDVDRDGHPDIVIRFFDDNVRMRRGDGAGDLGPYTELGFKAEALTLGDVVGDAGVDLVTVEDRVLRVREGQPDGKLGAPVIAGSVPLGEVIRVTSHHGARARWIAVTGSVDEGGNAHRAASHVLRYDVAADGSVAPPCALGEVFEVPGTVADLNGDDEPDVAGAATCGYCTSEYRVWGSR